MISLFSEIIASNSQSALLGFLLVSTERAFSVKELSMRLKMTAEQAEKAGKDLSAQNYLKTFSEHGLRFFRINLRHQQIPILRQELLKQEKPWSDELYTSLKKVGQLSGIFLSGIFVGELKLPVDLLLVGKVNISKLEQLLKYTQKFFGRDLNYSIMSVEEFLDRRDTFDRFIKDIFDYPHIVVLDKFSSKTVIKKK